MTFFQRFSRFALGLVMGLVLVTIFFGERELGSWLPEKRIRNSILNGNLTISTDAQTAMDTLNLNSKELKTLIQDADVHFKESDTRKKPCPVYLLKTDLYKFKIEVCDSHSVILSLAKPH